MGWFSRKPCEACLAKEAHLESLRAEVESLRRLVIPPTAESLLTLAKREADLVLSPDENHVAVREAQEAAALMAGTYDNWQVEVS